jgi:hypothetical protein
VRRAHVAAFALAAALGAGGCGAAGPEAVTPPGGGTRAAAPGAPGPVPAITPGPPVAPPGGVAPGPSTVSPVAATSGAAPRAAAPVPATLTAADLAWLDGVDTLLPRMDAVFSGSPGAMTAGTLRGLAGDLRICTEELARAGAPSDRLREVYRLVRRACRAYETGAECFADAAAARSASGVQHHLDCGFSAARRGGEPLAEARSLGLRLRGAG